jgi:hypothetical protein
LLGLILVIGLIAGLAYDFAQRRQPWLRHALELPFWLLWIVGFEHIIHFHLARYPPLWNSVAAWVNTYGLSATDGWFYVGIVCSAVAVSVLYFSPRVWSFAKPMLCGGAAVVWLGCAWKLVQMPEPLPHSHLGAVRLLNTHEVGPGNPVVWIILDEWDYDLTYLRTDGKIFPEFERLRGQSVFLQNVRAAGKATLLAIPSLLMGQTVREYRPSNPSAARFVSTAASETFPNAGTIFDTAAKFGYHSQIVGWYHPYCRMFGTLVESCWWDDLMLPALRPGRPLADRAGAFLRDSIELEIVPGGKPSNTIVKHLARVNPMVMQASLAASQSGRAFSFLHLPLPHGPFFRLEADGRITALASDVAGYQFGLDAADRAIGKIRTAMEAAGTWDTALVVVSSDHPYRYQFGGGYGNGHIPMMIKFPHQSTPVVYSHTFQAVETRRLIEDFMQGNVGTPERAVAWMDHALHPAYGAHQESAPYVTWGN